jgi:hypothetical protein
VTARAADGQIHTGVARAVLPDGALRIDLDGGGSAIVRASDVTLREQK